MLEIRATGHFEKWVNSLKDRKAKAKVQVQITKMSIGNLGDVKPIGERIGEARIHYGHGYRLYFIKRGKELIILLAGGTKRNQSADIKKAIKLAKNIEN